MRVLYDAAGQLRTMRCMTSIHTEGSTASWRAISILPAKDHGLELLPPSITIGDERYKGLNADPNGFAVRRSDAYVTRIDTMPVY